VGISRNLMCPGTTWSFVPAMVSLYNVMNLPEIFLT